MNNLTIKDLKNRVQELCDLQDGWLDGEQGQQLDKKFLDMVTRLLINFYEQEGFQIPYLYPLLDGCLQIEWDDINNFSIDAEIEPNGDAKITVMNLISEKSFTKELNIFTNSVGFLNFLVKFTNAKEKAIHKTSIAMGIILFLSLQCVWFDDNNDAGKGLISIANVFVGGVLVSLLLFKFFLWSGKKNGNE